MSISLLKYRLYIAKYESSFSEKLAIGRFLVSLSFVAHCPFRKFSINSERMGKVMEVPIKIHRQTVSVEVSA